MLKLVAGLGILYLKYLFIIHVLPAGPPPPHHVNTPQPSTTRIMMSSSRPC